MCGCGGANRINGSLNIICANELAFVPARAIVPLLHISGGPFGFSRHVHVTAAESVAFSILSPHRVFFPASSSP